MSELQMGILLKFYDSLGTQKVHGQTFIEHLTHKELIGNVQAVLLKNDLFPFLMHRHLQKTEQLRIDKLRESF